MLYQKLNDTFSLSGALNLDDILRLKKSGVDTLINARYDGEEPQQINSITYQHAAERQGMHYVFIPVKSLEYPAAAINQFSQAISGAGHKIHGFCRSGKRVSHLWALSQISTKPLSDIVTDCAQIGIDLSDILPQLRHLAGHQHSLNQ